MEQVENDISMSTGSISDNISRLSSCYLLKHFNNAIKPNLQVFIFWKIIFKKLIFKFFCVCLSLKKLVKKKHFPVNGKHFPVKWKFDLVSRKVFSFYFLQKTLFGSCEKFRNVILFVDYIKFDPQTFDCFIYFVLNICFSISSIGI